MINPYYTDMKKEIEEYISNNHLDCLGAKPLQLLMKEKLRLAAEWGYQKAIEERPSDERINKYARHQFNRGSLGLSLVTFEEWCAFPNSK